MRVWKIIRNEFLNRPFETQAILLISALAVIRIAIALIFDFARPQLSGSEIFIDLCLLFLFVGLLFLAIRKTTRRVHPVFGYLFVLLLAVNFAQFNGIHGTSKLNYFSGLFVTVLLYTGQTLTVLLIFEFVLMGILIYISLFEAHWFDSIVLPYSVIPSDFLFTLGVLGALSFYLKAITMREIGRHGELNDQLRANVSKAMGVNGELVNQADELKRIQKELEEEVSKRAQSLELQNKAIETYIHLNTKVLHDPINLLCAAISEMPSAGMELRSLLGKSAEELNDIFGTIKNTLEKQEALDRNKLRTLE